MTMDAFTATAVKMLDYARAHYPDHLTVVPPVILRVRRERVMKASKTGPVRVKPASMTVQIPDQIAARLKSEANKDILLLMHIPEAVMERANSRIILPGEVDQ